MKIPKHQSQNDSFLKYIVQYIHFDDLMTAVNKWSNDHELGVRATRDGYAFTVIIWRGKGKRKSTLIERTSRHSMRYAILSTVLEADAFLKDAIITIDEGPVKLDRKTIKEIIRLAAPLRKAK